ncbi:acetyl-CoA carboxylase biotin carboxylase subunit [Thermomonospora umbrina]|uniref:biotin carboxylase n=1 Tax=Thermomonospora umbrina TaxID=111806 RepID=A0A3D9SX48_9ACTN|nr:biotin carboxylase N-terminal domain-containing protein [Thermomonospora umbrina]REE97575.1 acetyl-CoA carboxylase biotin carboxylase subunit [Thermomonospora umbrina]
MFEKILIAGRGEIAVRIARTCREMGIRTVAVHSTADRDGAAARYADETVQIGPPQPRRSYMYAPSLIEAALRTSAEAVHPGYGFLSEDPDFARMCAENGLTLIGPGPDVMETIGDKARTRALLAAAGLPVLPGSAGAVASLAEAEEVAAEVGYPVIVKAVAGGGGRGIAVARDLGELRRVHRETTASARAMFGDGAVYLERYLPRARHLEVQVLCDGHGAVLHLGERDCSTQRRRQKLIEEAPAPGLAAEVRERLAEYAVTAAKTLRHSGLGTVEFLLDDSADGAGDVTFMEVNGRIQVEHPVTEMVTGLDLVREQIEVAAGRRLTLAQDDVRISGWAIECRINAEDADAGWRPAPGRLEVFRVPGGPGVRVDAGFEQGDTVPPYYDSMVAKLVVWAPDRAGAIARARRALDEFAVSGPGVVTTLPLLGRLLAHPAFVEARHHTAFVDERTEPGPSTGVPPPGDGAIPPDG